MNLRFPARNAQIKVHKLVVNACTDYFLHLERDGHLLKFCKRMEFKIYVKYNKLGSKCLR